MAMKPKGLKTWGAGSPRWKSGVTAKVPNPSGDKMMSVGAKPKVTPKPKPKSPDTGSMNGKQYDAHLRKIIADMKKTKR